MMKAAIVPEKNRLEIREIPLPRPGPYDALVKIDACAICTGTDSSIVGGAFPWPEKYPFVLGHESSGIVVEAGDRVRNFALGQRVTRPTAVIPGEERDGLFSQWGGYAQYGLVRDVTAAAADGVKAGGMLNISRLPLPDGVDPISGALSVNQREILSVARRIAFDAQSRLLVIGSGYNGLLFALFGKHFGAGRVVVAGNPVFAPLAQALYRADAFVDYRDAEAEALSRKALGGVPTHVIDAVGSVDSVAFSQKFLTAQTAFGCYGVHQFHETATARAQIAAAQPQLDMSTDEPNTIGEWHTLWQAGLFGGLYDAVLPFEQINEAFARLARREVVKIVLEMG